MDNSVLKSLGYEQSPNFISRSALERQFFSRFGHVYRKAVKYCGLHGVYTLNDRRNNSDTPVVFYCKALDEKDARLIHQRVWNQNVAPFVLVETQSTLRLYCGFRFNEDPSGKSSSGIIGSAVAFNEVAKRLNPISAPAIDSGLLWDKLGDEVTPGTRIDWTLLSKLIDLERELRRRGVTRDIAHGLIGKFVYLRYLRDREILSDRKLLKWGISHTDVFGRNARLDAFINVNERLENWLNGSIFPISYQKIEASILQLVSGVFSGDSPHGQLHLDFKAYDFSFIPIETISVIYEQFLHAPENGKINRGKQAGAYYTPLPLVNYIVNELESRRPLEKGMRVLDPACGSGAFLVQCYRALIEKHIANGPLSPLELSELLVRQFFGVDRDKDACQVAEMSLILTLLDYTTPPDLENCPRFKLPVLRGNNIFAADFFDTDTKWDTPISKLSFDWLVGNPPWKEFNAKDEEYKHVSKWVSENAINSPIGGNQIAEAFVWKSLAMLEQKAVAGVVLPAMTLFKIESKKFRQKFFTTVCTWCVANFSNLAYVLFAGRADRPAMVTFFSPEVPKEDRNDNNNEIITFSPFIINQRANRSFRQRVKKDTWSIVVNGSEIGEVSFSEASTGDMQPWKIAMWGAFRDGKLLRKIQNRFPPLTDFLINQGLTQPHQGFELRDAATTREAVESMPALAGELQVDFSKLKNCGRIFTFPDLSISRIAREKSNLRKRGGKAGIQISMPPHIMVDAARRFAIYSDRFIAVPPRKIGISGPPEKSPVLKALSLYLSSDFVTYQQFFTTPEWGISTSLATLDALKDLPVPLGNLSKQEIKQWVVMHDALAHEGADGKTVSQEKINELNSLVFQSLKLGTSEQILIQDFVRWNMQVVKGKVKNSLIMPPDEKIMHSYLDTLRADLDAFLGGQSSSRHKVEAIYDNFSAIVAISLVAPSSALRPKVYKSDAQHSASLDQTRKQLLRQHSQWLYFNRNLKVYTANTLYIFKPMENIQWTDRQAILDAADVIGETLNPGLSHS